MMEAGIQKDKAGSDMDFQNTYTTYKPLLQSIAYRLLGSIADAEDIVHDVFTDYSRLNTKDISNEKAYLIRMATNRCLNLMQSARKKREVYTGHWLPEPDVSMARHDPAELYDLNETLSYALLFMLEQLSAVERAVFILRESLQYDYREISTCLQKSEANCRKIYSRAKEKLHKEGELLPVNSDKAEPLVAAFIEAARSGDFNAVIDLLTQDAVLVSDGGGKVRAAIFSILGKERVLAFLQGVIPKGFLGDSYRLAVINGQTGIILMEDGQPKSVVSFQLDERQQHIERIFVMLNPDKLGHVPHEV